MIREVIQNQMDLYQEYVVNQTPKNNSISEIHAGVLDQKEIYTEEITEKPDKSMSDRVSSKDSSYGHHSEKDDYSDRGGKDKGHYADRSRRRESDRNKDRYRRSREDEKRNSRSNHRNGYDRHHEPHKRSYRERKY